MEELFEENFVITGNENHRIHKSDILPVFESLRGDETDIQFLKKIKNCLLKKGQIDWSPDLRVKGEKLKGVFLGIRKKTSKDIDLINLGKELPVKPLIDLSESVESNNSVNDTFSPINENKAVKIVEEKKTKYKEFEPQLWEDKLLSKTTITTYKNSLKRLQKFAKEKGLKLNFDKTDETISLIDDMIGDIDYKARERSDSQKASLRANYVKAIIWSLKEDGKYSNPLKYDIYLQLMKTSKKKYLDERAENLKNEREIDVWVDWNLVLKRRDELEEEAVEKEKKSYWKRCLILSLYTLFPPRRALDYREMFVINKIKDSKIKDLDENKNYYVRDKKLFIFKRYKSSNFYGTQVFQVNDKLAKIIEKWLSYRLDLKNGDSLLEFKAECALRQAIEKMIDHKGFTMNIMRKSFLSYKEKTGYKDLNERKEISQMMAHSIIQQLEYAKK